MLKFKTFYEVDGRGHALGTSRLVLLNVSYQKKHEYCNRTARRVKCADQDFRAVLQWSVIVGPPGSMAILVYRGVEMKRLSFSIKSSIQNIYQYFRALSDM